MAVKYLVTGTTECGPVRVVNEDAILFEMDARQGAWAFAAVADGLGGLDYGAEASRLAIDVLRGDFLKEGQPEAGALHHCFVKAHSAIHAAQLARGRNSRMGTTLVACLSTQSGAWLASVGDSRAYLLCEESATQLTEDHSVAAEQVRAGILSPAAAEHSAQRNVLTRCLGPEDEPPEVDLFGPVAFPAGSRILLCSDGLFTALSLEEMRTLAMQQPLASAMHQLVGQAISQGSRDNVSAVLISHADA